MEIGQKGTSLLKFQVELNPRQAKFPHQFRSKRGS